MKVETRLSLEGKTRIVEATNFPLKLEFFKEIMFDKEVEVERDRQYIALVRFHEDIIQLTGDCADEVAWKLGKVLLALLGEVKE